MIVPNKFPEFDAVILYIHQHLYDPLPVAELAQYVGYSPFHFIRLFKERSGLTPQYYVSSVRLQKAKELLLQTGWTIRDIGLEIGHQSLGTFTTRFTEKVGVAPSEFRNSATAATDQLHIFQENLGSTSAPVTALGRTTLAGTVDAEVPFEGVILVGLFPKPIPEGMPLYGTILTTLGAFQFINVKPGVYFLLATAIHIGMTSSDILVPQNNLRYRHPSPIVVGQSAPSTHLHITLGPPRPDDPPILISLPVLLNNFLSRTQKHNIR